MINDVFSRWEIIYEGNFLFCLAASSLPSLIAELDFYPIDSDLEIRNEKKESTSRLLKVVKMR